MTHYVAPPAPKAVAVPRELRWMAFEAFTEAAMLDNAPLVVWTKAQMRGVRAFLLRTLTPCR